MARPTIGTRRSRSTVDGRLAVFLHASPRLSGILSDGNGAHPPALVRAARELLPTGSSTSHLAFFFLGAGFMLVETKAITELGLAFGNTWQVIAIAMASILVMAFLANGVVRYLRLSNPYLAYLLLIVSVVVAGGLPVPAACPRLWRAESETVFMLTCPLFFSGIVFSTLLSVERRISSAMSMNLMGALVGGVLDIIPCTLVFTSYICLQSVCMRPRYFNPRCPQRTLPSERPRARNSSLRPSKTVTNSFRWPGASRFEVRENLFG